MNNFKRQIMWFVVLFIAGVMMITLNIVRQSETTTVSSFGVGLCSVSTFKLVQFYRLSKKPEFMKKYKIAQNEERYIYIAHKSGYFTYFVSIMAQFLAIFMLIIFNKEVYAMYLSMIMAGQVFVYLISYYVFSKKY